MVSPKQETRKGTSPVVVPMNHHSSLSEDEKKDESEPAAAAVVVTSDKGHNVKSGASISQQQPYQQQEEEGKTNNSGCSESTSSSMEPSSPASTSTSKSSSDVVKDGTTTGSNLCLPDRRRRSSSWTVATFFRWTVRISLIDIPLLILFGLFVSSVLLHRIYDDYLYPQIQLMQFSSTFRDESDTTYYHRTCDVEDLSARTVDELVIPTNYTTKDMTDHMLRHGASVYQNLLTNETASELREWIVQQNKVQEGWYVIKNENRYSWGIDMNMHPKLLTYWRELLAHPQLIDALQAIVGPDPAIIEFTAITASYGAVDQHDHADVVPSGNAAKYAHTFLPSYSLFIPLQDTTYEMGATHVCPGTHLCSDGCPKFCPKGNNIAMSGPAGQGGIWPMGWGALMNQATTHKGMGYTQKGGIDRVVLIATFAPRPQTGRTIETRMIGHGGSYSLLWHQWGHTFYDYVHADTRMTEPQKTLRSLGLIKANGWDLPTVASMRIANQDNGYTSGTLKDFIENKGFWFLPQSWQLTTEEDEDGEGDEESSDEEDLNEWNAFVIRIVKRMEKELRQLNIAVVVAYLVALVLIDVISCLRKKSLRSGSMTVRAIGRMLISHGFIMLVAWMITRHIDETSWAKSIKAGKAFRIPVTPPRIVQEKSTIPLRNDVLLVPQYVSSLLGSYGRVLDFAHPGNKDWKEVVSEYQEGYMALPPEVQIVFCNSLVRWMETDRRFLMQDEDRYWFKINDDDELLRFCDRELTSTADPLKETMLRVLGELKSETEYGRWRGMAIYEKTSRSYLKHIEEYLYPPKKHQDKKSKTLRRKARNVGIRSYLKPTPRIASHQRKFPVPATPGVPHEPFAGAWFQEGDIVESKYHCKGDVWYKATIETASPGRAHYVVEYFSEDGELDWDLGAHCLRPFEPYKVGDRVDVRDEETGEYSQGEIVAVVVVDGIDRFDVQIDDDEYLFTMVTAERLRRFEHSEPLDVGSRVMARFQGGIREFSGTIKRMYSDGTAAILYDDGDYERLDLEYVTAL